MASPAQAQVVQNCQPSDYLDRTATGADRQINWDFGIDTDPERCLLVRTGQKVVWQGNLDTHPLGGQGGDQPNPIGAHVDGSVTFTTPGTFGFKCLAHSSMVGAIKVVAAPPTASVPGVSPSQSAALASMLLTLGLVLVRNQRKDRWPAGV